MQAKDRENSEAADFDSIPDNYDEFEGDNNGKFKKLCLIVVNVIALLMKEDSDDAIEMVIPKAFI